ncbi:MAG TPA: glycosyltransferase, partial [Gemmatimonadales bacterium]|nr:glycosyltransferase [Gemmatimonadales bacterium]
MLRQLLSRLRGGVLPVCETVDVVIPVYRGMAETRACIESVLAARGRTPFDVVVIDDCSPEPQMAPWLAALAVAGRITLVTHAENRGFVASANAGMAMHPDRDVVLLNSDTEVAPGWLDRLAASARRDRSIGTATPFSNNAT